jgi:hypothetical protein
VPAGLLLVMVLLTLLVTAGAVTAGAVTAGAVTAGWWRRLGARRFDTVFERNLLRRTGRG